MGCVSLGVAIIRSFVLVVVGLSIHPSQSAELLPREKQLTKAVGFFFFFF